MIPSDKWTVFRILIGHCYSVCSFLLVMLLIGANSYFLSGNLSFCYVFSVPIELWDTYNICRNWLEIMEEALVYSHADIISFLQEWSCMFDQLYFIHLWLLSMILVPVWLKKKKLLLQVVSVAMLILKIKYWVHCKVAQFWSRWDDLSHGKSFVCT